MRLLTPWEATITFLTKKCLRRKMLLLTSKPSETLFQSTRNVRLLSPMSSSTTRVLSKLSSRLQPLALKLGNKKASFPASLHADSSLLKSTSQSAAKRTSWVSRLPVELSAVETMMPLHSAIASARLTSSLSIDSQTWGLVPQGISLPL